MSGHPPSPSDPSSPYWLQPRRCCAGSPAAFPRGCRLAARPRRARGTRPNLKGGKQLRKARPDPLAASRLPKPQWRGHADGPRRARRRVGRRRHRAEDQVGRAPARRAHRRRAPRDRRRARAPHRRGHRRDGLPECAPQAGGAVGGEPGEFGAGGGGGEWGLGGVRDRADYECSLAAGTLRKLFSRLHW